MTAKASSAAQVFPKAILFDWDNTLIDSWAVIHAAMNHTLVELGQEPWSRVEIETRARLSLRDSFPTLFGADWPRAEKLFYDHFESMHLSHCSALPGVVELLEYLATRRVYLAVVSNKRGAFLRKESTHLGWDRYFSVLAGAGDAARDKPALDHVEFALKAADVRAGPDVWFVGDTDIDLHCAHDAGCIPVLVRPAAPLNGEFNDHPPVLYQPDCHSLRTYLQRL